MRNGSFLQKSKYTVLAFVLLAFAILPLLTGCLGNGDAPAPADPPPVGVTLPPVGITSANAVLIAGKIDDILGVSDLGELGRPMLKPRPGTCAHQSFPCLGGGSVDVNWNDVDGDGRVSTGDTSIITFNDCRWGLHDPDTITGQISITDFTLTGSPPDPQSEMSATYTFIDLKMDSGDGTPFTIKGDFTFTFKNPIGVAKSIYVTINSLTGTEGDITETISNFSLDGKKYIGTGNYTHNGNGRFDSTEFDGHVTFVTTETFEGRGGMNPNSGVMKITGANNSSVTITALSCATSVELSVDANGDGVADDNYPETVPWTDL